MVPDKVYDEIKALLGQKSPVVIAIDGRCGAGKTTLAKALADRLSCNLIHMDDFFLRPEQRSEERLRVPGENVDHERFLTEVLLPLKKYQAFSYRPYDCQIGGLKEPVWVSPKAVTVVEGSYACHPKLWDAYDLHIFLDIDPKEQMARIIRRNGEKAAEQFRERWIPLEEKYFEAYRIKERCELSIHNMSLFTSCEQGETAEASGACPDLHANL